MVIDCESCSDEVGDLSREGLGPISHLDIMGLLQGTGSQVIFSSETVVDKGVSTISAIEQG